MASILYTEMKRDPISCPFMKVAPTTFALKEFAKKPKREKKKKAAEEKKEEVAAAAPIVNSEQQP